MKTLIVLLLVAFVAAEQKREAGHYRGLHGYSRGYSSRPHYMYGVKPAYSVSIDYPVYAYRVKSVSPYGANSYHPIHKREAEPSYGLGHQLVHGLGYYGRGAAYGYQTSVYHPGYGHSHQYNRGVVSPGSFNY
ncbi:uncharacterized protein LOC121862988 [Homarus americanus]|uniref:uncharacterized protein LOC121862988 n=1 Tax=Homarus americanus TaxID=6706 RepID=UPI001C441B7B|nr:uncharacterized protein LOC121862988 [Homarus americanus]